jgi:hypothetical protein
MRRMWNKVVDRPGGVRSRTLAIAIVVASLAALSVAAPALASLKQDLQRYSDCPYANPVVVKCVFSTTTSGEFVIGKSTVPINQTVTIQAGIKPGGILVAATDGNTLSKTPLVVPGGLVGISLLGNFTEVTATAELAGQAELQTSVTLPLKVKLGNPLLGNGCYVGSEAEPLSLHLIYGTTNPPPPNKPISGESVFTTKDKGAILVITGKLVDNAFAAPGANGCTLLPLIGDLAVNIKVGLPSAAGTNTAIMAGVTEEVSSELVKGVLPLPDLGRCQKVEGVTEGKKLVFHGGYSNATCTETSPEKIGKFEWTEGPGPKRKFAGAGKALTLATVGGSSVTCSASTSEGEYTGGKTQTVSLKLTGCQKGPKGKGVTCQTSPAKPGEIATSSLEGGMEFIKENEEPATPEVGVDLKAASGSIATFECGGASASVGGSVIVPVTAVDKMAPSFKLKAAATAGKQTPEAFEVGPTDTLTFAPSGGGEEQAGLTTTDTNTNQEPLEIKAVA